MAEPVAIVGGGPAGMAVALGLHRQGIPCQIFDARARAAAVDDKRILALSHGARLILETLGAWEGIPQTPIETIHISHAGGLGRTLISAAEEGVPGLGYVLAAGDLAARLDRAVAAAAIPFHEHSRVDAPPADAPLTIWAEGAIADHDAVVRDFGQHAVLFTATAREAHGNRAWERFTPEGPVAVLPYGKDLAVVLTCRPEEAQALAQLEPAAFLARLQARFGGRLRFTSVGERYVFPLGLRYRRSPVAERQAWIGNAAQTLHPVAGQGFNLALRDIFELPLALAGAEDPGAPAPLARYAAGRRLDRYATMGFTSALVPLFSNDNPLLLHARGAGLLALDLLPPLRSFLARRLMFGARAW